MQYVFEDERNDFGPVAPSKADYCDDVPRVVRILRMDTDGLISTVAVRDSSSFMCLPSRSAAGYSALNWSSWESAAASKTSWSDIDVSGVEESNVECMSDLLLESGHVVRRINIIFKGMR